VSFGPHWASVASGEDPSSIRFRDVANELRVHFTYRAPELDPLLMHRIHSLFIAPGVAVADVNRDGWMDLFFVSSRAGFPSRLYLNTNGTGFREAAAEWQLDRAHGKMHAADGATFFDYNNDGRPDLYLSGLGCSVLLENTGTSFTDVSEASGLRDCRNSMSGIPIDFDNDGLLDLYVLRYWGPQNYKHLKNPRIYVNNFFNADNAGQNSMYRNLGGGRFADVTSTSGGGDSHWSMDASYADLDGDGSREIYIANDYGPDIVYSILNGQLTERPDLFAVPDRRYGMNASLADFTNDGKPSLYVSNAYDGPPWGISGNFLWRGNPGSLSDESRKVGLFNCGFAWGGAAGDFNLDGYEDLYVANGFISDGPKPNSKQAIARSAERDNLYFKLMTVRSLPGTLSEDIRRWPDFRGQNVAGNHQDCLFLNAGNAGFINIAGQAKIDVQRRDGRAVGIIDYDNDGLLDLVVTYRDGPVTLLHNESRQNGQWIGLLLQGKQSNRDAAGARIEAVQNGISQTRWLTGGRSGFLASSDPRVHFGLRSGEPVEVAVTWPSGKRQSLGALQPGGYHTVEEQ